MGVGNRGWKMGCLDTKFPRHQLQYLLREEWDFFFFTIQLVLPFYIFLENFPQCHYLRGAHYTGLSQVHSLRTFLSKVDWAYVPIREDQIILKCRVLKMNGLPPRTQVICSFCYQAFIEYLLCWSNWLMWLITKEFLVITTHSWGWRDTYLNMTRPAFLVWALRSLFRVPLFICPLTLIYT